MISAPIKLENYFNHAPIFDHVDILRTRILIRHWSWLYVSERLLSLRKWILLNQYSILCWEKI